MAARKAARMQPAEIGAEMEESSERRQEPSPCVSKMVAVLLVLPGIVLYIYILYIVVSNLVFPGSLSPFLAQPVPSSPENATSDASLTRSILRDSALLCLFLVQHTLMACRAVKGVFEQLNLSTTFRPFYVFSTCCAIQFIYYCWESTPAYSLWQCDSCFLHYVLLVIHVTSWISIACSVFAIDYLELLGIKQIYYAYRGFNIPMTYKSSEQQHLLLHLRHPIFLSPTLILWAVPIMTYDRLLVAVMLPLYLAWGSQIDYLDDQYVREQFHMKKTQLLATAKTD